jgi:hypothetical protein
MDSSTCSAVGWVPDALLLTVEAAMASRRAGHNRRSRWRRHTLRTQSQGRRRRRCTRCRRR